jgi:hypothetical protein
MSEGEGFPVWVIYDHPRDFPQHFVARKQVAMEGYVVASGVFLLATDLERLRERLLTVQPGLVRLDRHPSDDPVIVETWI